MLYLDTRLGRSLSEARLEEALKRRLQKEAAEAESRRMALQQGRKLRTLGQRSKDQRDRAA